MALTFALELESTAAGSGGGVGGGDYSHTHSYSQSHGDCSSNSNSSGKRERMFEKVVTPSDVGKLNRLVVPKQFAERHLPLRGAAARSRGTVLCFHDARGGGTAWRFRYSYWSSSQSYVMTKGWNRYVRDKRLAAGDTVAFCRDGARLYIDCRRRKTRGGEGAVVVPAAAITAVQPTCQQLQGLVVFSGQNHQAEEAVAIAAVPPMCQQLQGLVVFSGHQHQQAAAAAVVQAAAAAEVEEDDEEARQRRGRWLRLFGVNLLELRADPVLLDLQL